MFDYVGHVNQEISPTRWLFLDMNSFFASVEQQECPQYRGRPIAVAPMVADSTCVIAASYEAKWFGVKTGTNIKTARSMCPELIVVGARPKVYIDYHLKFIETVKQELPNPKTLSVDEIACRLWANEAQAANAVRLALHLKAQLHKSMGEFMHSSVGIAPNVFLAKVAADIVKPNGLTIVHLNDLPMAFKDLVLRDLPGIGRKMHVKLHAANIHTINQLYEASEADLGRIWGGVVGRRWWYMLRGSTESDYTALAEPSPRSVSNSHVIEPALRSIAGAEQILLRLLGKATSRLRLKQQMACRLELSVTFQADRNRQYRWHLDSGRTNAGADLLIWLPIFRSLWASRPKLSSDFVPKKVAVAFTDLIAVKDTSGCLFDNLNRLHRLSNIMDLVNAQFSPVNARHNTIDLASIYWLNHHAPERIAFKKITDDDREKSR